VAVEDFGRATIDLYIQWGGYMSYLDCKVGSPPFHCEADFSYVETHTHETLFNIYNIKTKHTQLFIKNKTPSLLLCRVGKNLVALFQFIDLK
jgi:hypothetical protein